MIHRDRLPGDKEQKARKIQEHISTEDCIMGAKRNTISWLHISDFHFKSGDAYDRDKVLNSLLRSLPLHTKQIQPDLILATGDVAHSGQGTEYRHATRFFESLLNIVQLDASRMFVIPGNHDVTISKASGLKRSL